jgi:Fic family protein
MTSLLRVDFMHFVQRKNKNITMASLSLKQRPLRGQYVHLELKKAGISCNKIQILLGVRKKEAQRQPPH